jgi:glycosyltransferase involved in cell wall biosynthesis
MKIVFLSNYFNHHQRYLSNHLAEKCEYTFIETEEMEEERVKLGWRVSSMPDYVMNYNKQKEDCDKLINEADVVVYGSAPYDIIKGILKSNKIVIKYSERIYKKPLKWYTYPYRLFDFFVKWGRYRKAYLFCASAYAYSDYMKTGTFINKAYKWGYFPETKKYDDIDELISKKKENSIMWCGRFIDWKHPEYVIELAKSLKNDGYSFHIDMMGNGELEDEIKEKILEYQLDDYITMHGSMKPDKIREHMEQSEIYVFTSDRQEGWGAVLNESMNSACAVVANNAIGSAPYLINDGENGLLYYNDKNSNELIEKVKLLLDNAEKRREFSKKAYETIVNEWNAESAANKLIILAEKLLSGEAKASPFNYGICSKAN